MDVRRRAAANEIAKLENHRIGDRIEYLIAGLAIPQDSRFAQNPQMSGYIGLIRSNRFDDSVYASFAALENIEDPQAQRIAEDAKTPSDQIRHVAAQWSPERFHLSILTYDHILSQDGHRPDAAPFLKRGWPGRDIKS